MQHDMLSFNFFNPAAATVHSNKFKEYPGRQTTAQTCHCRPRTLCLRLRQHISTRWWLLRTYTLRTDPATWPPPVLDSSQYIPSMDHHSAYDKHVASAPAHPFAHELASSISTPCWMGFFL